MPLTSGDAVVAYPELRDTRFGIHFGLYRPGSHILSVIPWAQHFVEIDGQHVVVLEGKPRRLVTKTDAMLWEMGNPGISKKSDS